MKADFPEKLGFLFKPARYKVLYGGRGGAKSWGIARALLILGYQKKHRILCARETMNSIADSVHALLADQIGVLGLSDVYEVQKSTIINKVTGTEFAFAGLRHNVTQIKSYESFDLAWVEEAQAVSKSSWEILIPTIRAENSEIWISFNPDLDTDDTYRRFITSPPPGAIVVKMNWRDNPWFPDVLRTEMLHLKATDPAAYEHVWEGLCLQTVEGAVYEYEMRAVDKEQRITKINYDPTKAVHTFWDIGYGDSTAIWFAQAFPYEYRLIDYLEGDRLPLKHYLTEIQKRGYVLGTTYLPHDAKAHELGSGRSVEELIRAAGHRVQIVSKLEVSDGINAARTIFGQCWFDGDKCADGIQGLRHYRWSPEGILGQQKRQPLHDWASHPADSFRYFAIGIKQPTRKPEQKEQPRRYISQWN